MGAHSCNGQNLIHGDTTAPIPLVTPEAQVLRGAPLKRTLLGSVLSAFPLMLTDSAIARVVHHLGYGPDDIAMEAIRNYLFVPAMRQANRFLYLDVHRGGFSSANFVMRPGAPFKVLFRVR